MPNRLERGCDEIEPQANEQREAGLGGCRVLATTLGYAGNWRKENVCLSDGGDRIIIPPGEAGGGG
jgi:hypothetical protein